MTDETLRQILQFAGDYLAAHNTLENLRRLRREINAKISVAEDALGDCDLYMDRPGCYTFGEQAVVVTQDNAVYVMDVNK